MELDAEEIHVVPLLQFATPLGGARRSVHATLRGLNGLLN